MKSLFLITMLMPCPAPAPLCPALPRPAPRLDPHMHSLLSASMFDLHFLQNR